MKPKPLNSLLYRLLENHFGCVRISNQGTAQVGRYRFSPITGRDSLDLAEAGEYYQVCCPFCNDTRFRLFINHRWGQQDEYGKRNLWLAICYNENCLADYERRLELYDTLTARDGPTLGRARILPGKEIDPSEVKADWPGPVTRVDQLPRDHKALQYLISRDFDPERIGKFYNIHYCHESRLWLAKDRLIIPIYENRKMMGWQARFIGELDWHGEDSPPKYYTMPGTPRRMLVYNLANAATYETGVIVEGPTDVWAFGPMACCTLGSTMTYLQQRKFVNAFHEFSAVLLYDPDVFEDRKKRPGMEKLIASLQDKFERGFAVVKLPGGRDPGSLERGFLRDYVTQEARRAGVKVSWRKR